MIRIDSRPSRSNNMMMCAQVQLCGAYLYPGVPNITFVIKETDCDYGQFEMFFCKTLEKSSANRLVAGKKISFPPWLVRLFILDREGPETGISGDKDAFDEGLSKEKSCHCWELLGAVPHTLSKKHDVTVPH